MSMIFYLKSRNGAKNIVEHFAKLELQKIFNHYNEIARLNTSRKLVTGIVKESKKLSENP